MRISLLVLFLLSAAVFVPFSGKAQQKLDSILPIRGFCIDAPRPAGVDSFVLFINQELAPRKVNTLFIGKAYFGF